MVDLEREIPTFGFFETLESRHNDGAIQRCGKAQERRLCWNAKPRPEGRIPRRGGRLREDRPTLPGNTGNVVNESPRCMIPTSLSDVSAWPRHEGQSAVKAVVAPGREKPLKVTTPRTDSARNKAERTWAE
jgi:hypothetical protein